MLVLVACGVTALGCGAVGSAGEGRLLDVQMLPLEYRDTTPDGAIPFFGGDRCSNADELLRRSSSNVDQFRAESTTSGEVYIHLRARGISQAAELLDALIEEDQRGSCEHWTFEDADLGPANRAVWVAPTNPEYAWRALLFTSDSSTLHWLRGPEPSEPTVPASSHLLELLEELL